MFKLQARRRNIMNTFDRLAIESPKDLIFGKCPTPLETKKGMVLGGGEVYPELNFTLPPMLINKDNYNKVKQHYKDIIAGALNRAVELYANGVVIEFETLPDITQDPQLAEELCRILLDEMDYRFEKDGLKSVLRMTPNDNREMVRPPIMRSGEYFDSMLETFKRSAAAGAELLSIESVGGKELHDYALTTCDIKQVIFSLCIMGVRDMKFLWKHIVDIAAEHNVYAAGDTACGFANTAMVLADRNMIPRVFAAVDRAVSTVRSLVAYEMGAVGPGKDCGYENIFLKAITGLPMATEGKTAACAHLSPIGNLPMAYCDLWSNESVQNVKLLGGMAPTVSMEQLIYDCRLMNLATEKGDATALELRNLLVESDAYFDPQAYIFTPENVIEIAQTIVDAPSHYLAGRSVALKTVEILRNGMTDKKVDIQPREQVYLDFMQSALEEMPDDENAFIDKVMTQVDQEKFTSADYQLPCGCGCH